MQKQTEKQKIGKIGEDIAANYLENKNFSIIGRNYLKKCGEIDIIAQKGAFLHFIEVKSVSRETDRRRVSRVTDIHRPEDNVHPQKLLRLSRTIQVYLLEKYSHNEPRWSFDVIIVYLDVKNKKAQVRFLEDLIL